MLRLQRHFPLAAVVVIVVTASAAAQTSKPAKQLHQLFDEAWEYGLREAPTFASRMGDSRFNDRLGKETLADYERRAAFRRQLLKRLDAIDSDQLSDADRLNAAIFRQLTKNELDEYGFKTHLTPISHRWGFHIWVPDLPKQTRFRGVKDYEDYLARLGDLPRYAGEQVELMRAGIRDGFVLPAVILEGYEDTIRPHIVETPEQSLLYAPFKTFAVEGISDEDRARLRAAARKAVKEKVVPTFERFLSFMQKEYLPASRGSIAASTLPDGRDFYRHRVRQFTTLDISPDEVHQLGVAEVARIRAEMMETLKRAKFDGDLKAFVEFLKTDEQFYAKTPAGLQKEVAWILKRADGQLPRLFKTLPRTPYGLREVPAYVAPKTTSAYYMQPAGDGSQAGFYYINTYNLKSRPLYEMEALSLHEAVPGHHLQLALQQELTELPKFRRFAGFTAFVEGWALYAERLGLEMGFYQDPYTDFGRLSFEMWRACRLVVDTGMHYKGWSRSRAITFMSDNTALSDHNIRAEVNRYISWPGQALAYKMGELKIRQLRKFAETELGDDFDVREFHDVVLLSGSVPLNILEENVRAYVKESRSRKTSSR